MMDLAAVKETGKSELEEGISVKVSTGPAQRKKGAQKCPCKQTVLQGQSVFTQS